MPARYVIGTDGIIAYSEVNPDYTQRPDPSRVAAGAGSPEGQQGGLIQRIGATSRAGSFPSIDIFNQRRAFAERLRAP